MAGQNQQTSTNTETAKFEAFIAAKRLVDKGLSVTKACKRLNLGRSTFYVFLKTTGDK